jgi:signal transduction histidine kinase
MIESCVNKMDVFIHKTIEYYKGIRLDDVNEDIDFKKMFTDSIELCNMQNPQIVFDVQVDQQAEFSCDGFRLSLILNNLISNAVKYQRVDEANPKVKLTATVNEKEAVIHIEDNGVGIIEEHLNKIFQIFFRSTDFKNGLGYRPLHRKRSAHRIGGDIVVKSEFGKERRLLCWCRIRKQLAGV